MQIYEAILHGIDKDRNTSGAGTAATTLRETVLAVDQRLERTAEAILRIYGKSTSGYGTFDSDEAVHRFPVLLQDYADSGAFVAFSIDATKLIAAKMAGESFATGGYALLLRYSSQNQDWLLVAMLKLKPGTGIDQATLELSDTLSFDIDHLHEAARVNLDKWKNNEEPYLSFIKKRQNGNDVSRYFREALGCTEYTDSRHQTEQMLKAFEEYVDAQAWSTEQKRDARQRIFDYCEAKSKAEEPANLTALSAVVNDQDPETFSEFVREKGYEVSETFTPHKQAYIRFKRIARKFGSVSISFDVNEINTGRVDYDEANECLVIRKLPEELIEEIKRHKQP